MTEVFHNEKKMGFCNEIFASLDKVIDRLCDAMGQSRILCKVQIAA